jgi:hypothetical protein
MKRSNFTREEDCLLFQLIKENGTENWKNISNRMKTKNARQCQERWDKYLNPSINTKEWNDDEDNFLIEKVKLFGKKWMLISKFFNNRTDAQCKNRFNKLQRKYKKQENLRETFNKYSQLLNKENNIQKETTSLNLFNEDFSYPDFDHFSFHDFNDFFED